MKSTLCIRGKTLLYELCEKYNIPHKKLGKWIIAQNEEQYKTLQEIHERCKKLGVATNFVSKKEAINLEPEVRLLE